MTDYSHLDPKVVDLLELPDLERANRMLIDRFITHERLKPIMDHIDFLRFSPAKSRASGLVVSVIRRFRRKGAWRRACRC